MHFTVLLLTLLLDRLRPVAPVESLLERLRHALALLARATWAGESHNPWLAVALVSAPVAALLLIARSALGGLGLLLDLIAMLLVVRLADVLQWAEQAARALDEGDDASAAAVLAGSPMALASLPGGAAARGRTVIQVLLLTVHARLFAPVLWYVLLPGCIGPVLYLLVREVYAAWTRQDAPPPYAEAATRLLRWADWLPARATALAIAVVGNFEDDVAGGGRDPRQRGWRARHDAGRPAASDARIRQRSRHRGFGRGRYSQCLGAGLAHRGTGLCRPVAAWRRQDGWLIQPARFRVRASDAPSHTAPTVAPGRRRGPRPPVGHSRARAGAGSRGSGSRPSGCEIREIARPVGR
ncbi:MAG: hypothetical protein EBT54_06060, partial [Betaproteobacteria bacterium]|nr:hypothetical protein [Betaproteobacteria bacterium]